MSVQPVMQFTVAQPVAAFYSSRNQLVADFFATVGPPGLLYSRFTDHRFPTGISISILGASARSYNKLFFSASTVLPAVLSLLAAFSLGFFPVLLLSLFPFLPLLLFFCFCYYLSPFLLWECLHRYWRNGRFPVNRNEFSFFYHGRLFRGGVFSFLFFRIRQADSYFCPSELR